MTKNPTRYPRGALRWHARYCREVHGVTLAEAAAVAPPCSSIWGVFIDRNYVLASDEAQGLWVPRFK